MIQSNYINWQQQTGRGLYLEALRRELAELVDPITGLLAEKFSQHISCPLCGMDNAETLFVKAGYTHVRCLACGMGYINPQVPPEITDQAYANCESVNLWVDVLTNPTEQEYNLREYGGFIDLLEQLFIFKDKYLLDIGCGTGDFMVAAKKRGWLTTGLELNSRAAAHARSRGLDIIENKVEYIYFIKKSFPAIALMGLLEHLADPVAFLKTIRPLLTDDGVIISLVPNFYGLYNMILRERSMSFDGRNHLMLFSLETVRRLFEKCGFDVVHQFTTVSCLNSIIKHLMYHDPDSDNFSFDFVPPEIGTLFQNEKRFKLLEQDVYSHNLGHRIITYARKRSEW